MLSVKQFNIHNTFLSHDMKIWRRQAAALSIAIVNAIKSTSLIEKDSINILEINGMTRSVKDLVQKNIRQLYEDCQTINWSCSMPLIDQEEYSLEQAASIMVDEEQLTGLDFNNKENADTIRSMITESYKNLLNAPFSRLPNLPRDFDFIIVPDLSTSRASIRDVISVMNAANQCLNDSGRILWVGALPLCESTEDDITEWNSSSLSSSYMRRFFQSNFELSLEDTTISCSISGIYHADKGVVRLTYSGITVGSEEEGYEPVESFSTDVLLPNPAFYTMLPVAVSVSCELAYNGYSIFPLLDKLKKTSSLRWVSNPCSTDKEPTVLEGCIHEFSRKSTDSIQFMTNNEMARYDKALSEVAEGLDSGTGAEPETRVKHEEEE